MSYFTKKVTKTYEFEEDIITVVMRRVKKKDIAKIAPMLGEPDDEGEFKMKFSEQMEFMGVASELLLKYVESFTGLTGENKDPISLEYICEEDSEAYFISLISEMFGDLMSESFSKGTDEKKSVKLSENILKGVKTPTITSTSEE